MKNLLKNCLLTLITVVVGAVSIGLISYFLTNGNYKAAGGVLLLLSACCIVSVCLIKGEAHYFSSTVKGYINILKKREENEGE